MTLPDAERLVAGYLRARPAVTALVGARVSTELPATPVFPAVTLTRVGGLPGVAGYLDRPRIELSCWAATKAAAHALARIVEDAMLAIVGAHAIGTVTGIIEDGLGLQWNPDPDTDQPRYQFLVELYTHP